MYRIKQVDILGFGGSKKVEMAFKNDINIIIGKNGTGKTRFINIVQSILNADYMSIVNSDFENCTIVLMDDKTLSRRTIKVYKTENDTLDVSLSYKIGTRSFSSTIPGFFRERGYISSPMRRRTNTAFEEIRKEIRTYIETSSISVNRDSGFDREDTSESQNNKNVLPSIDNKLTGLLDKLRGYQLELSSLAGAESIKFQQSVLSLMLYDAKLDRYTLANASSQNLDSQREGLYKAYKELGAFNGAVQKKIDEHIKSLKISVEKIKTNKIENVDDLLPIPLLARTQQLIDLSSKTETARQLIFSPVTSYILTLKSFMKDKNINMTDDGSLTILDGTRNVDKAELSSGEKQILIIMTEALLQKKRPYVFFADEPEISLHIEWQSKVVAALRSMNPNAQIIIATHSPEIAAGRKNDLINMSKVTIHG